ncbi:SCP2 sterol-binding domain-containing protein [Roseomonas sp. NAR14]|uniref:SCP2 sterol-binding domain-containing protein n=1 Tax=Roseomonas acroporae TaxID=2937791 RepID=A0A9X2BY77_9PROT|nr:SCP2 sterol-binding domain-containing protein [Roseomonas acroporae]MCK8785715.1 SCP2 sterol-binding domain-containing protein [Roseomonas acroporae]
MEEQVAELDTILARIRARAAALRGLGYRVRFELTDLDESILLDATGGQVTVEPGEGEAATVLRLSSADMEKLIQGRLSPMLAFSTGRLRVEGSKGVALKLASLLDED